MDNIITSSFLNGSGLNGLSLENLIAQNTNDATDTFKQLLTVMLLASTMSNMGASNSSAEGILGGGQTSFSPLLLDLLSQSMQPAGNYRDSLIQYYGDAGTPHMKPVEGVLTQEFQNNHIGVDTGIPVGTPIKTTMDGKIVYSGWNNEGYGNLIIVENGEYRTYYAHLSECNAEVGDSVKAGEVVGLSGNTGNSTGPHLHYEVRRDNKAVDPTLYYGRQFSRNA